MTLTLPNRSAWTLWCAILWVVGCGSAIAGVRVGDSADDVRAQLGEPRGVIETPSITWWYYERGRVQLADEEVVAVALISVEEAEQRAIRREREEQLRRAAQRARQEQQRQAGLALKEARLQDPHFMNRPAQEQVAFWREFQMRYPSVPVHAPYAAALERYQREAEQERQAREQERRIRDLEQRILIAETRTQPVIWPAHTTRVVYHQPSSVYCYDRRQSVRFVGATRPRGASIYVGHSTRERETRVRAPITDPSYLDRTFGPWSTPSRSITATRQRPAGTFGSVSLSTDF